MAESHSAGPALQGRGAFAQLRFQLQRPRVLVGRVPPADLVLDDPSVSRLHAEVSRSGSRLGVRDLGSVSGTFLNGDRVSEAPLKPGDLIRFGTVELVFEGLAPAATSKGQGTKRNRVFLAAGMALVVVVVGAALLASRVSPNAPVVPARAEDSSELLRKTLGKCLGHSDLDSPTHDWSLALKACQEAVDLDPTHSDARALLKRARRELEMEALLKEATLKGATSQDEDALTLLARIDKTSSSLPRAARLYGEIEDRLLKRNKAQCLGDCSTGRFEEGMGACLRALQLTCNQPDGPDAKTLRSFQHAARQLGRSKEFDCPPHPFRHVDVVDLDSRRRASLQLLAERYQDPKLRSLLVQYHQQGAAKKTAEQVKALRLQDPARRAALAEIIQLLEVIDGRFATWQGLVRQGRAQESLALVDDVAQAESRLLPPPVESQLLGEMKAQTARLFLSQGKVELERGRPDLAFKQLEQGYRLDPRNTDLVGIIGQLEREASRRLGFEPGCESYRHAAATTRSESNLHERAVQLARAAGCNPPVE